MTQPIIWHNPRCSKSRQTLAILVDAGHAPEIRKYLEDAPSAEEINAALSELGIGPFDLVRKGESEFKDLGLGSATDEELITVMAANPILIERPIVFSNGKAAIGRPPETVLNIL